jgi:SAM-dependent methyltransferase
MPSTDPETSDVKAHERHWQERHGGALQARAYQRPGTRVVIHRQFDRIERALKLSPGLRVLDIGCGIGHLLAWLATRTPGRYFGLDVALNSVRQARTADPGLHVIVGDAEQLPYRDRNFDRVSCNGSAHHLLHLPSAIREIFRVLVPGGVLVMYEPAATPLTNVVRRMFVHNDTYESPGDLARKNAFTRRAVTASLVEAGFDDVAISAHDFLAYPLTGMYIDLPLGRSQAAMVRLSQLESRLERWTAVGALARLVAWRWLIVATKPMVHA